MGFELGITLSGVPVFLHYEEVRFLATVFPEDPFWDYLEDRLIQMKFIKFLLCLPLTHNLSQLSQSLYRSRVTCMIGIIIFIPIIPI